MEAKWQEMLNEKTLVLLKPDAVKRGLIGQILQRFEQAGLKIVAGKMVAATKDQIEGHFPKSEEWVRGMGSKTIETYCEYCLDPIDIFGTDDPYLIGLRIKEWNCAYLSIGPVFIFVLQGIHAIDSVRKMIGNTLPYKALPGTIRGDFSINAPDLANVVGSACKNIIHASGNAEEAAQEINNWFSSSEILIWERIDEYLHFVQGEFTSTKKEEKEMKSPLQQKFEALKTTDPRDAAEYAYVLAMINKRNGSTDEAIRYGREAITLFDQFPMETLEQCAARNVTIENIAIPDIIHQEVVRDRLKPLVL